MLPAGRVLLALSAGASGAAGRPPRRTALWPACHIQEQAQCVSFLPSLSHSAVQGRQPDAIGPRPAPCFSFPTK